MKNDKTKAVWKFMADTEAKQENKKREQSERLVKVELGLKTDIKSATKALIKADKDGVAIMRKLNAARKEFVALGEDMVAWDKGFDKMGANAQKLLAKAEKSLAELDIESDEVDYIADLDEVLNDWEDREFNFPNADILAKALKQVKSLGNL
jgi:Xaa-Pro aminopeptidase